MHLAPRGDVMGMGDPDRPATFGYVARELGKRKLAFLCAREHGGDGQLGPSLKKQFGGVYIANEKYTTESAAAALSAGTADAVAFGVPFIANPDLPERFRRHAPLNPPDKATFYAPGPKGYTDYPKLSD